MILFGKYAEIEIKEQSSTNFGNTLIEIDENGLIVSGILATWNGKEVKLNLVSFYSGNNDIFTTEVKIWSVGNDNQQKENHIKELQKGF